MITINGKTHKTSLYPEINWTPADADTAKAALAAGRAVLVGVTRGWIVPSGAEGVDVGWVLTGPGVLEMDATYKVRFGAGTSILFGSEGAPDSTHYFTAPMADIEAARAARAARMAQFDDDDDPRRDMAQIGDVDYPVKYEMWAGLSLREYAVPVRVTCKNTGTWATFSFCSRATAFEFMADLDGPAEIEIKTGGDWITVDDPLGWYEAAR